MQSMEAHEAADTVWSCCFVFRQAVASRLNEGRGRLIPSGKHRVNSTPCGQLVGATYLAVGEEDDKENGVLRFLLDQLAYARQCSREAGAAACADAVNLPCDGCQVETIQPVKLRVGGKGDERAAGKAP